MKRFLFGFLAVLFLILNTIPYLHIMADQSMTDSQLKQVGAFALSSLITTGEATELDFSDYTDSDTDFLLALGELVVTGDPSGLVECGLEWLGDNIDDAYDSAIQSIRIWEYNNLPNSFYYWFIDENPPYELAPSYNNIRDLSQPLRRLLTPPNDESPTPSPPTNQDMLSLLMVANEDVNGRGFFWREWPLTFNAYWVRNILLDDWYKHSYFSYNDNYGWVDIQYWETGYIAWESQNRILCDEGILTLNITSNPNDTYIGVIENIRPMHNIYYEYMQSNPSNNEYSDSFGINSQSFHYYSGGNIANSQPTFCSHTSTTLSDCLKWFVGCFHNINVYVDGVLWAYVGQSDYPIIIPDQLTIWNDQPLEYTFPNDTYLKLPDLTNIITNAINNSGVVMWSDIVDCFVDVNGQTAVAVTKIVRNDYDNLYMEQYPYPAMLVGMTEQTRFNEHLLDDSHSYLSPMGTLVQETVNVLPSELVGVLAIGAILTIFAVIINRLLE